MTAARGLAALVLGGSILAAAALPAAAQADRDFDPARHREDLVLIQPLFTPPELLPDRPDSAAASPAAPDSLTAAFRVQVITLSREHAAREIAEALGHRLGLATGVVAHEGLYSVRAGAFAERAGAERLMEAIARLHRDYAGAFVVADSAAAAPVPPPAADPVETGPPEAPEESEPREAPEEARPEVVRLQGWRVLIEQDTGLQEARDLRSRIMSRLKRQDVDILFEEPWYKILVGDFRTHAEAQQLADRCRRQGYRSATPVQGEIEIPEEQAP